MEELPRGPLGFWLSGMVRVLAPVGLYTLFGCMEFTCVVVFPFFFQTAVPARFGNCGVWYRIGLLELELEAIQGKQRLTTTWAALLLDH